MGIMFLGIETGKDRVTGTLFSEGSHKRIKWPENKTSGPLLHITNSTGPLKEQRSILGEKLTTLDLGLVPSFSGCIGLG